jgi:predicted branched-subunit amino acid permease
VEQTDKKRSFAAGVAETSPLLVGVVGISIPVGLIALACVEESVVALVFAVLAMFAVGATTLGFVLRLASDEPEVERAE